MHPIGQIFKNKFTSEEAVLKYVDNVSSSFFSYFTLYLTDARQPQRVFTLTEAQLNDHWQPVEEEEVENED